MNKTVTDLIIEAAARLGNETKPAITCRVSRNAIWQAKKRGRVSGELSVRIHWATEMRVPGNALRRELGWRVRRILQAKEGAEGCWTRCKQRRSVDRLDEDHGC
jgi:hypothetical protein